MEFNVKDGFRPLKFADDVDADYLFSHTDDENFYRLLNEDSFGHIKSEDVDKLIDHGHKVVVVENSELKTFTYNIDKMLTQQAFMNHKHLKKTWKSVEDDHAGERKVETYYGGNNPLD